MAKLSQINMTVLMTLLAIGAGWVTWALLWPLGLILYIPLLARVSQNGRKPATACVLLSPFIAVPIVYAVMGGFAFTQGTATLMARGPITVESTNLDPRYRVPVKVPPRTLDTRNAFGWLPYEVAVRSFGHLLGPMRGSYTGSYPGRVQAWRHLDAAPDAFVEGGVIKVGLRYATLPPTLDLAHSAPLRAHRTGRTLIVGHPDQLWLIDEQRGAVFATWRRPQPDPPRARWPDALRPAPAVAGGVDGYASPAY